MSEGYFDSVAQADTYFEDERLETWAWDDLAVSGDSLKSKVLKQAYNRIYYDPTWELPTYDEASSEDLVDLRKANAEMAYYLAVHIADEDRRKGLQAQGVVSAGIVKETYSEDMLKDMPVPPMVRAILDRWKSERPFGAIDLERDEEESVNTKVHDF